MLNELYKTWGIEQHATHAVLSGRDIFTCYETVDEELRSYTREQFQADPERVTDEIFAIYRKINVVPIYYYTKSGLIEHIKELTRVNYNPVLGEGSVLKLGNNNGQGINRFLFPNMMTAEPKGRGSNSLRDRFYDDVKLRRAIRICFEYREGNFLAGPTALRRALELVTGENIQNFKALNARAIVEYLSPATMFSNVYDYSAGYGGRMLGICTAIGRHNYECVDPNTETVKYLTYLSELIYEATGNQAKIIQAVSEEYKPAAGTIDVAFSSPPYFNLEKYSNEPTQCMNKFTTLDDWFDGYAAPTMQNIYQALDDHGVFATNIADYKIGSNKEFKVVDRWIETAEKLGFKHEDTIKMMLNTRPGVGNDKTAGREKWEGIYVFTK